MIVIPAPRLGFLNLIGESARSFEEQDERAFSPFFASTKHSSDLPPECDVLVAYLRLEEDGSVANSTLSLDELVRRARAPIVLIATANTSSSYKKVSGSVNLVMTLDRRDPLFAEYFSQIFAQMKRGVSMLMAWVALSPQTTLIEHRSPVAIFLPYAGHIAFAAPAQQRREPPSFLSRFFGRKSG